jgi:vancomycin aglycone glucosyltransferase
LKNIRWCADESRMRIVLTADGSRGDLQPMIELCADFAADGHDAFVCGPPDFAEQAAARGVAFVSTGTSFKSFLDEHADMVHRPTRAILGEAVGYLKRRVADQVVRLVEHTRGADLVLAGGAEFAAASAAERNGVAYRYVVYCPAMFPSREHGPAFLPWQRMGRFGNRLLWPLMMGPLGVAVSRVLRDARRGVDLPPPAHWMRHVFGERPIVAADRLLAPTPSDVRFDVQQIPALHPVRGEPLPEKLAAFLDAGTPPVYIGFGSMPDPHPAETTAMLLEVVEQLGCRAVIGAGWAELGRGPLPAHVMVAGSVSHPTLFARCAAVVHHGGAGTTTTAARAGAPQVLVPHAVDQFYWGRQIERFGLGVATRARRRLGARELAEALAAVLDNEVLRERTRSIGAELRAEAEAERPSRLLLCD